MSIFKKDHSESIWKIQACSYKIFYLKKQLLLRLHFFIESFIISKAAEIVS